MGNPTRRSILESLRASDIDRIARHVFPDGATPRTKGGRIDLLVATRRCSTAEMLTTLSHKVLTQACIAHDIEPSTRKAISLARLTANAMEEAKELVNASLRKQGYQLSAGMVIPPALETKDQIRAMHQLAVQHKKDAAKPALAKHEQSLLSRIANGVDVDPQSIDPAIRIVLPRSEDALLFRYASLHWSIPISPGYGRRIRALVIDRSNGKLIGIIGLCDPVYSLRSRDEWIGWNPQQKAKNIKGLVDAYVLGAVPPYSSLLCGKLVALLACSTEIRAAFAEKYRGRTSLISKERHNGQIAAITTTSALGRSSIYNRLRHRGTLVFNGVGYTVGNGDFQFLNGTYEAIRDTATRFGKATAKNSEWGVGFRSRREVVQKFLTVANISQNALRHGIRRELFIAPLAQNAQRYLQGVDLRLDANEWPTAELSEEFMRRWLAPRVETAHGFEEFDRQAWRLWP